MPTTASPYGLRPVYHPSGRVPQERGTIESGYATAIYRYTPVKILPGHGTLNVAAAGERAVGSFLGCEFTLTATGKRTYSPQWPASTAATEIVAYYTRDQLIRYEIQSSAAVAVTDMGAQLDWGTATAGNATTGMSEVNANVAALTPQGDAGLRIVDVGLEPDNAWGDTYTNIIVEISEHQDTADRAGYGSST